MQVNPKSSKKNVYQKVKIDSGEDKEKDADDTLRTICTDILCYTKIEFSLGYKAVFNCAILYLVALMITSPEFSKDPENNQINP